MAGHDGVNDHSRDHELVPQRPRWSMKPEQLAHLIPRQPRQSRAARLITIDGPAGAGKSTYAAQLGAALSHPDDSVTVIAMDDLYDGWDGLLDPKLPDHLTEWILQPLLADQPIRHPVFDWTRGHFDEWRTLPTSTTVIVEGVGAGYPSFARHADVRLWLSTPKHIRLLQLQQRSGPPPDSWWPNWQRQEAEYFAAQDPRSQADWIISPEAS